MRVMSFDPAFWCDPKHAGRDAQVVYETLLDGREVEGSDTFAPTQIRLASM